MLAAQDTLNVTRSLRHTQGQKAWGLLETCVLQWQVKTRSGGTPPLSDKHLFWAHHSRKSPREEDTLFSGNVEILSISDCAEWEVE